MLFEDLLRDIEVPRFVRARYHMEATRIEDIPCAVRDALAKSGLKERVRANARVCIAVGSRDIENYALIVRTVADCVKAVGAEPFLIPAMGSHGGSTAEGQLEILRGYGITEISIGAPILADMRTVEIGRTADGHAVHMDRHADQADFIIPIGRIKPHTDFRGKVESGLCKMLAIGLGKQHGAYLCHQLGFPNMGESVWAFSKVIVEAKPNIIAVGIIENAYHQTYKIVALPAEHVHAQEPALLEEAKRIIGRLPFESADVLVVDEFGKDISGGGMDPNVTGRSQSLPRTAPFFKSIMVRRLTENSHGNCGGIGNADVITRRFFDQISFETSYPNAITAAEASGTKIPVIMPTDSLALKFAIRTAVPRDVSGGLHIVWIQNTLKLDEFLVSEDMVPTARSVPNLKILDDTPWEIQFDEDGNAGEYMV